MKVNEIYFNKRKAIIVKDGDLNNSLPDAIIATMLKNIEFYGYTMSEKLISKIKENKREDVINIYNSLMNILKKETGFKATKKPLYSNFPTEVMDKEEAELYMDAITYYLSSYTITPKDEKVKKYPLLERVDLKVIDLGSEKEFMSIFTNIVASKSSVSESDFEILEFFVDKYGEKILNYLPTEIPFKENLAEITMLCMEYKNALRYFTPKYKTATDVLRLATAISGGDVSLAENTMYTNFKRADRRFLLNLLEKTNNLEEDMLRHKNKWIRLGEKLHPSEYKKLVKVNNSFNILRNNLKFETFNSKVEKCIKNMNVIELVEILSKRPGEFARKLDNILRNCNDEEALIVLNKFEEVSIQVATPLLLQVREHFSKRNSSMEQRVFFPKGSMAKAYTIPNKLCDIEKSICDRVEDICTKALVQIYSEREPLGKVYIDESLTDYLVPTTLRSSSRAVKTIARGSKMQLAENCNTVRLFLYWQEPKGMTTDLDLSAVFYDEEFEDKGRIYFGNLRNHVIGCTHSGDVREAPEGGTEFIDLDLNALKENGIRYIVASVNSFTGQPFIQMPDCFVGFMERENGEFGEIFEPKTVSHKADLTSDSGVNIPMVIDVVERKAIWTDLAGEATQLSSVRNKQEKNRLLSSLKSILNTCKPNLYDLALLNVLARGEVVETKEDADIVFSLTEGVTPFDTDIILAKYI